jgi:hypothetical protein
MNEQMIIQPQSAEVYEVLNQISFNLDQLEKALFKGYENYSDFQFIFDNIREKLKQQNTEGITALLNELEDLLDA